MLQSSCFHAILLEVTRKSGRWRFYWHDFIATDIWSCFSSGAGIFSFSLCVTTGANLPGAACRSRCVSINGRPGRSPGTSDHIPARGYVCSWFHPGLRSAGATASTLGGFLRFHQFLLREIGGIRLIIIGLHLTGLLKLPFLYWQKHFEFRPNRPSYPASFAICLVFDIGWTPCVGLILGPVLVLASNAATLRQGVFLLLVYSLGLGVPFLLLGLGLDHFSKLLKWLKPHAGKIEIGTGVIMILMGVMIYFDWLIYLNRYFNLGVSV